MTNVYIPGSDYDSMAGWGSQWQRPGGPVNPQKSAIMMRPQYGRPAPAEGPPMPYRPPMRAPMQQRLEAAEALEMARGNQAILGLDSGAVLIAAGATQTINTFPQKPCVLSRMIVSTAQAGNFILLALTVGTESVLLTNGVAMSLSAFEPASTAPDFRSVLAYPGVTISAQVTNTSAVPQRFTATLYAVPWVGYGLIPS